MNIKLGRYWIKYFLAWRSMPNAYIGIQYSTTIDYEN